MTLPFSDKPENSSIYQDVKTETLQELTPDQFDAFKARMFAEGVNGLEDEYRRLLLLGLASDKISTSGPIPGTMKIERGTSVGGVEATIFQPPVGEVWEIVAISQFRTGATASTTSVIYLTDGTDRVLVEEVSDNSGVIPLGTNNAQPLFVSNDVYLTGAYSSGASATNIIFLAAVVRVR